MEVSFQMRTLSTFVAAAVLIMLLVACNGDQLSKERAAPTATDADLTALAHGNAAFAFDLYEALREDGDNLFYSPYSISLALAMTYAGARGDTETQMADTLHFDLPQDSLHPTFNALDLELASRGKDERDEDAGGFTLNIANAVWAQHDYEFQQVFIDLLAESYGAGVRHANFREAPDESRVTINDWIADRTEDRIIDLIPEGVITDLTRMVLTNAIYFKAAWALPFEEQDTSEAPFRLLDGSETRVPMMRQTEWFAYAKGDGYQVMDLPYVGHEVSMTILLPDEGRFREFEDSMDAALVEQALADAQREHLALVMPKFEFESQFELAKTLERMGMPNAFDNRASDFSGMDGNSCFAGDVPCLFIRDVIHQAFVSVDEQGTEAAAATAVMMQLESEPSELAIDRPFIFLVRDSATGAILFLGRLLDPHG